MPLDRATVGPAYLRVAYPKKQVKGAFAIDTNGELPAADEPGLFEHYGLAYRPGVGRRAPPGQPPARGARLMAWFLLLIIVAIILGNIGAVAQGLLHLLIIGALVLLADIVFFGARLRRRRGRPVR